MAYLSVSAMRAELEKRYSKDFVKGKSDYQIMAIYNRIATSKKGGRR